MPPLLGWNGLISRWTVRVDAIRLDNQVARLLASALRPQALMCDPPSSLPWLDLVGSAIGARNGAEVQFPLHPV